VFPIKEEASGYLVNPINETKEADDPVTVINDLRN